ncbi:MAG: tRNA (N(6)-L-threonylcarbamoyladenosine(37)-C(2))-methylthiotransferase [Candidatus Micrarchaeaceae archaeon]
MQKRAIIETYGCTLNQADSDIMAGILSSAGIIVEQGRYEGNGSGYDYVIVNTCTVKTPTEQKILNRLERLSSLGGRLIVVGCLASADHEKIAKVAPLASILNTSNITRINDAILEVDSGKRATYLQYQRVDKLASFRSSNNSVIARIPISEGCLSNCTFCETKYARGPLNSFSEELIIRAARMSIERGAKEIELTSQDAGAYGFDKKTNIAELAMHVSAIDGEFRIRIGMLNPEHLHKYFDELVEAYKNEKVYKFAHLPVQSGSDNVLKAMRRGYSAEEFKSYVSELRSKVPGISIATDVIVGYPTETDSDFEKSMALIKEITPSVTNVSKFGARPHAQASKLKQLPNHIVKERSIKMSRLVREIQSKSRAALLNTEKTVLITELNGGSFTGRDDSYNEVAVINGAVHLGEFKKVMIIGNSSGCVLGSAID